MQRFSTRGPHTACHESKCGPNVTVLCVEHNSKSTFSFAISYNLHSFKNVQKILANVFVNNLVFNILFSDMSRPM